MQQTAAPIGWDGLLPSNCPGFDCDSPVFAEGAFVGKARSHRVFVHRETNHPGQSCSLDRTWVCLFQTWKLSYIYWMVLKGHQKEHHRSGGPTGSNLKKRDPPTPGILGMEPAGANPEENWSCPRATRLSENDRLAFQLPCSWWT